MLLDDEDNALIRLLNSSLNAGSAHSISTRCSWKPTGPVAAPCERESPRVGRSLIAIAGPAARAFSSADVTRAGDCHSLPSSRRRVSSAGRATVVHTTRSHNESSGGRHEQVAFRRENNATETESNNANGNGRDALALSCDYNNFEMDTRLVCAMLCITYNRRALLVPSDQ